MAIAFYCGSVSPIAWRVWLTLEHKQLPYELKMLSCSVGDLKTEEFTKLNPRRKIPVIVDQGFVLYELVAIAEYLEDRYPAAGRSRLFPESAGPGPGSKIYPGDRPVPGNRDVADAPGDFL